MRGYALAKFAVRSISAVGFAAAAWASPAPPICGDGIVHSSYEECDDGGLCIGGSDAGESCHLDSDCVGLGVCDGGADDLRACDYDAPNSCASPGRCIRCKPFGGDGCSANCTLEQDVKIDFNASQFQGVTIPPGTSGLVYNTGIVTIPVSFPAISTRLTLGGFDSRGVMPIVLKAANVGQLLLPVQSLVCECSRSLDLQTCGGTLLDLDGSPSNNCTLGNIDATECPVDRHCASVFGPGNAAAGEITCGGDSFDAELVHDCGPDLGGPSFDPVLTLHRRAGPPSGSAMLRWAKTLGSVVGRCEGPAPAFGPDGRLCTDDDPPESVGSPTVTYFTSTHVMGTVENTNDFPGDAYGPFELTGAFDLCGGGSELGLVGVSTACSLPTLTDTVLTQQYWSTNFKLPSPLATATRVSTPTPGTPAPCLGDCDGDGQVTVDEIVTAVNYALTGDHGGLPPCLAGPNGLPDITVDVVIRIVGNALDGCGS